jgi:hypothetical protein
MYYLHHSDPTIVLRVQAIHKTVALGSQMELRNLKIYSLLPVHLVHH